MTRSSLLRSALVLLAIPFSVSCQARRGRRKNIAASPAQDGSGPAGDEIAAWARSVRGDRLARGECWDLAHIALQRHGCQQPATYEWGRKLSSEETILPGDIIQFHKMRLEWTEPDRSRHWLQLGQPNHTAIVIEAKGGWLRLAHQNFKQVRQVTFLDIDLARHRSGRYQVYRPIRAATGA